MQQEIWELAIPRHLQRLHADSIVIDGLIIAKWNRELFEDMRKGGLTAANCTVSVWEGFQATVNNIAASQKLIRENSDLVIPVRTTADIRKAKEQGKTGILFGFERASAASARFLPDSRVRRPYPRDGACPDPYQNAVW